MKKILLLATIALAGLFISCEKENNGGGGNRIEPGWYIMGDASPFEEAIKGGRLGETALDKGKNDPTLAELDKTTDILSSFVYLEKGKTFYISDGDGNKYGVDEFKNIYQGASITDPQGLGEDNGAGKAVIGRVGTLTKGGKALSVSNTSVYLVTYNPELSEVNIFESAWGLIGIDGWDNEDPLAAPTITDGVITWVKEGVEILKNTGYKFRYGGGWGLPLQITKDVYVTNYSDITTQKKGEENVLSETPSEAKPGGDNIFCAESGIYTITLTYTMATAKYAVTAKKTGESTAPVYPEKLYMIGGSIGGWDWAANGVELISTLNPGVFWTITPLKVTDVKPEELGIKFAPGKEWKGDFGIQGQVDNAKGTYARGTDNVKPEADGLYMVVVDMAANDGDGQISIVDPAIYLVGDTVGAWPADALVDANKFTIDHAAGTATSPITTAEGQPRICIVPPVETTLGADWWKAEFGFDADNNIVYRGTGGDPTTPTVAAGKSIVLNFTTGKAEIK